LIRLDPIWFYALPLILVCLAIWTKHKGVWFVTVVAVALTAWSLTPDRFFASSEHPSEAVVFNNGVWILPKAQLVLQELNAKVEKNGIAYSENNYKKNCQQKTGLQLLAFPKIKAVWTYNESGWCLELAASVPDVYSIDPSNTSDACVQAVTKIFAEPKSSSPCILKSSKADMSGSWYILLNCSQSDQQYQLRWFGPNFLTGGETLESFGGVSFKKGQCLDASHEELLASLLDIVGLGKGTFHYSKQEN
jgi:hypothetical protein